jgi:hypothetical protein
MTSSINQIAKFKQLLVISDVINPTFKKSVTRRESLAKAPITADL